MRKTPLNSGRKKILIPKTNNNGHSKFYELKVYLLLKPQIKKYNIDIYRNC